ncbi:MAG TPA: hypothetical protein VMI54_30035 [Polyangiaceae bacterium]|nr:hypothetical protein [Polyangiaceae bacterium]
MTMPKWALFIVLCMVSGRAFAEPNVERFAGVARSAKGEVVYRERHEVTENGGRPLRAVTRYFDPKGREIGRLETDFSHSLAAPSYRFVDERTGKSESASVNGTNVVLDYEGRKKALDAKGPEPLVVGQGLHHYVRQNLERLAHETVTVRFAVPSRLDTYVFRIRPLDSGIPGVVRLRIESDNWLVRQLAPHLEVDYELSTRRLLRYRGVSNLETPDGSTQDVEIRYAYGDAA